MSKKEGLFSSLVASLVNRHLSPPPGQDLRRVAEIMSECQDLVNNSENLETVASRFDTLITCLEEFKNRPPRDLKYYGITFSTPPVEYLSLLQNKKSVIFDQAIDRACQKAMREAMTLKTAKGRENRLSKFYDSCCVVIGDYGLPSSCYSHLEGWYRSALWQVQSDASL